MNTTKVLVEILSEEGGEGSHNTAESHQTLVQHAQGLEGLVRVATSTLAATAVQTHVAVREGVDEFHQTGNHRVQTVGLHFLTDEADELLGGGQQPAIHDVGAVDGLLLRGLEHLARLALPDVDVLHQEAVGVVPGNEHVLQHAVDTSLAETERLSTHDRRVNEVQTDGVGSVLVDDLRGVRVVLKTLAHLLAVLSQDQTVDNEVLEGRLVEQGGGEHHEGVEPATGLIKSFSDELGREVGLYM